MFDISSSVRDWASNMPDYLDMLATRVVALVLQLPVVELVAEVLREWLNISVG